MLVSSDWPTEMLKTTIFGPVGYNSSSIIYLFFGMFAFFTPVMVNKIGIKCTIAGGAVFYVVFLLATEALLYTVGTINDDSWGVRGPIQLLSIAVYLLREFPHVISHHSYHYSWSIL